MPLNIDDMTANKEKELLKSVINRKPSLALLAEFYSKEGNMNTDLASFIVDSSSMKMTVLLCAWMAKPMRLLKHSQHTVGDTFKGFPVYTDMKQNPPDNHRSDCHQDQFGWGTVMKLEKTWVSLWIQGLPDKEIVVSPDILLELKELWPKKGDHPVLRWTRKNEYGETLGLSRRLPTSGCPAYNNMQNQNWPAVYRLKLSGTFVYLSENNMLGLSISASYAEPRLGQV